MRLKLSYNLAMIKTNSICLCLVFVLSASVCRLGFSESDRPNILFVFADDWGRIASAYAKLDSSKAEESRALDKTYLALDQTVKTPHFDRLASEGVLFRNAFVSAPSCTPSRAALMSGQHFWRAGSASILRGAKWNDSLPAFPLILSENGYHIGETYKVWSPGTPNDAPFGSGKFAYEKKGGRFNQFSSNVTKLVKSGETIDGSKQLIYNEIVGNFESFLEKRESDKPFFYFFGPTNVHRKWQKGSGKKLWGIEPEDLKGKLPPFLADVQEVREDLADYLGEIEALDASLGLLLDRLEQTGELERTMIIVSGDHGPPGFPHGKCNLYDYGTRVPLVIRWGTSKGGRVVDDLVSLTDLAPTILEASGIKVPASMTGRSLLPQLLSPQQGQIEPHRDTIYFGRERHVDSARADYLPYPQRAIRTHDFLYIVNFKPDRFPLGDHYRLNDDNPPSIEELTEDTFATLPDDDAGPSKAWLVDHRKDPMWQPLFEHAYGKRPREELYDLRSDPHQMSNVAGQSEYGAIRMDLENRLLNEMVLTQDPRLIDDGKFYETPPMAGPAPESNRLPRRK